MEGLGKGNVHVPNYSTPRREPRRFYCRTSCSLLGIMTKAGSLGDQIMYWQSMDIISILTSAQIAEKQERCFFPRVLRCAQYMFISYIILTTLSTVPHSVAHTEYISILSFPFYILFSRFPFFFCVFFLSFSGLFLFHPTHNVSVSPH